MKSGERNARVRRVYDSMEHDRDERAERRFRHPVKAYAKGQTMSELRSLMQAVDRINDDDRHIIHGIAVKYADSR